MGTIWIVEPFDREKDSNHLKKQGINILSPIPNGRYPTWKEIKQFLDNLQGYEVIYHSKPSKIEETYYFDVWICSYSVEEWSDKSKPFECKYDPQQDRCIGYA